MLNGSKLILIFPSSIAFTSNRSLIIWNINSDEVLIFLAVSTTSSFSKSSTIVSIISANPLILDKGFFKSWAAIPKISVFSLFSAVNFLFCSIIKSRDSFRSICVFILINNSSLLNGFVT